VVAIVEQLGFEPIFASRDDPQFRLALTPYDELCAAGAVRVSVLMLMADLVGGLNIYTDVPEGMIPVTRDISLRVSSARRPERIVTSTRALRVSSSSAVMRVGFADETGAEFGVTHIAFSLVRSNAPGLRSPRPQTMAWPARRYDADIVDWLGLAVTDATTGEVCVTLGDRNRNSNGVLQGGVFALLSELSGQTAIAAAAGTAPRPVESLDLRYLRAGSAPTIAARALPPVGDPALGVEVEVRDGTGEQTLIGTAFVAVAR
jgi:acyl-coenzyme A thioesterase PaaI-like protein